MSPLYPNPALSLVDQPPVVLLAMCLFGETRGEAEQSRRAVAQVIINRARYPHPVFGSSRGLSFGENLVRVLTRPRQFSCFLTGDVNYRKIFDPLAQPDAAAWPECLAIADELLASHAEPDLLTYNSDHYFDDSIEAPSWADPAKETVKLGRLRFFRIYLPALQSGTGSAKPSGDGTAAGAPPSQPASSSAAFSAAGEALQTSLPASATPPYRDPRWGTTRRLGGRELSSLESARQQMAWGGPRQVTSKEGEPTT
jgi:hypothetical protein